MLSVINLQYQEKIRTQSPFRHLHRPVVEFAQTVTDVSNWERARRAATLVNAGMTTAIGVKVWLGLGFSAVNRLLGAAHAAGVQPAPPGDGWDLKDAASVKVPSGSGFRTATASRFKAALAFFDSGARPPLVRPAWAPVLAAVTTSMASRWSSHASEAARSQRAGGALFFPDSSQDVSGGEPMEHDHWLGAENDWSQSWFDYSHAPVQYFHRQTSDPLGPTSVGPTVEHQRRLLCSLSNPGISTGIQLPIPGPSRAQAGRVNAMPVGTPRKSGWVPPPTRLQGHTARSAMGAWGRFI